MADFLDDAMDEPNEPDWGVVDQWLLPPEEDDGYHDFHVGIVHDDGRWVCATDCPHPDHAEPDHDRADRYGDR